MRLLSAPWRLFTWLYESHPKETVAAILLLVALSAGASGYANIALGQANARNAVTSCKNSNESRDGARALWGFVVDLLVAANPSPTPAEAAFTTEFRQYVDDLYRAHDCQHLDKVYPAPKKPQIPAS